MSDWIHKAKDFIKGHPEQAEQGLDKAEEMINQRTGGKYADKIDRGADAVREQLGLPADEATQPPTTPEPVPGPAPDPGPAPTPGPTPVPEPMPEPTPGQPSPSPAPEPMPPVNPNDPSPVDPSIPGSPGPSEIPPGTEPTGEQDVPGAPKPGGAGTQGGDITLGDPPKRA